MHDGFVHALCEYARENFVVSVEEGDGAVIARVIAAFLILFVKDRDDAFRHVVDGKRPRCGDSRLGLP